MPADLRQHFALLGDHEFLVFELNSHGPSSISAATSGSSQEELVKPRDLRQHLQIGEVLRLKILLCPLRRICRRSESFPQFVVSRITPDHVHRIRLEQVLQREAPFVRRQIRRRLRGHLAETDPGGSGDIILYLRDQRRNQIEGLMDIGKFVQQLHHAVIILQGVEAHPGQAVLAGDQVLVKRLVLVPQEQ